MLSGQGLPAVRSFVSGEFELRIKRHANVRAFGLFGLKLPGKRPMCQGG